MIKEIWFDMDGTLADLYAVDGWLEDLQTGKIRPYLEARPMINMQALTRALHRLQRQGYKIGVITWTAKGNIEGYHNEVAMAKYKWLHKHLTSVEFDRIDITHYGMIKSEGRGGILFDDDENNREEWASANCENLAFDVDNIIEILKGIK